MNTVIVEVDKDKEGIAQRLQMVIEQCIISRVKKGESFETASSVAEADTFSLIALLIHRAKVCARERLKMEGLK